MKRTIKIEITLGNDAMRTGADVATVLRDLASKVEHVDRLDVFSTTARDANGNKVATMVAS